VPDAAARHQAPRQFGPTDTARRETRLPAPRLATIGLAFAAASVLATAAVADPPAIRTSDYNRMPACVTPARLMHFLRERNPKLDPRFDDIAKWYRKHGEAWQVRWDYAFYQMIIETNYLSYRTGSGRWGDVNPNQNNFAGIGTTGGGVPGDGYKDVSTGVLAQIQHLVAYSGERLEKPVAPRTQLKQDDIISASARLRRTVTFADLAGRWAVDRRYGRSIEWVAERFRAVHCNGRSPVPDDPPPPTLVRKPELVAVRQRSGLGAAQPRPVVAVASMAPAIPVAPAAQPPASCQVHSASYVGKSGASKVVLIRAQTDGVLHLTALQVLDGFERSMSENFIKTRAPGGSKVGEFDSSDAALARAYELCPSAR
jgi:hypothetical protein